MLENYMRKEDLPVNYFAVEVKLKEENDFLKTKETLTRIGIASKRTNTLYQSCHILHKQGRYFIVHFKELFSLDGKPTDITQEDLDRRNIIAKLLEQWELVELVDPIDIKINMTNLKIVSHKDKTNWTLESKYSIGNKSSG